VNCPACHHSENTVIDSRDRQDGNVIRRRRRCDQCGQKWTTYEGIFTVLEMKSQMIQDKDLLVAIEKLSQIRKLLL
jgi:transcriptional regulator NrdR family protein